jgi:hypothetical protein
MAVFTTADDAINENKETRIRSAQSSAQALFGVSLGQAQWRFRAGISAMVTASASAANAT